MAASWGLSRTLIKITPAGDLLMLDFINSNIYKVQLPPELPGSTRCAAPLAAARLDQPSATSAARELFRWRRSSLELVMAVTDGGSRLHCKEVVLTPTHLAIGMEYAAAGELFERICNAGRFSEDEARFFFQQLISGVSYCHSMGPESDDDDKKPATGRQKMRSSRLWFSGLERWRQC
ncbi:uncharacterized protein [Miscanthus floridulus]|uniref:uncharacterized protein n=1 Tax=Miscanthus floridulus TaxID=154761 RepID=UPI00345846B8